MKPFIHILIFALFYATTISAQKTYTDHVQDKTQGQGTVTISNSGDINELVNGKNKVQQAPSLVKEKPKSTNQTHKTQKQGASITHSTAQHKAGEHKAIKKDSTKHEVAKKPETNTSDGEFNIPVLDLRKKVMRKATKVTGYRVQVFTGGNSRNDKTKAQNIGNNLKMKMPDQPVYVHFYSPRWICRIGNYRSMEEATAMLHRVKSMGYRSASIVKGKITVQY